MSSFADVKSQVLAATDIVALISQSVELKRRGKNYIGLCPFHQERSPSFNVNPAKQYYMCFGCKKSGNAIDFVIERDKLEFIEALKLLAQRAGIEIPKFGLSREKTSQRQLLLDAHTAAATFFREQLQRGPLGPTAREYLNKRGFTDETIFRFGIGVTGPGWDALTRSPALAKLPHPLLVEAGLAKARAADANRSPGISPGIYDTFRNRLMFPIRDEAGRVIAFGGRVLPGSDDPAKYLNSPETPLFSKSRCIYGIDLAREEIQRTATVAIVEGYTDVAMSHQFGVSNVVSILGTAMTTQHLGILRRFAKRVVLLFDADLAGDTAVRRALELFIQEPIELCVASLPDELDPDEYLLKYGPDHFRQTLATAADALSFLWKTMIGRLGPNPDLTSQQHAVTEYLDLIARARAAGPVDTVRWGGILTRVSKLTQIPTDELHRRFRPVTPTRRSFPPNPPRPNTPSTSNNPATPTPDQSLPISPKSTDLTAQDRAESQLLGTLLANPHLWASVQAQVSPAEFRDIQHRRLAEVLWTIMEHEGADSFAELLISISEHNLSHFAIVLVEAADTAQNSNVAIADALQHFAEVRRRRREQALVSSAQSSAETFASEDDQIQLLKSLSESVKRPDPGRNLRSRDAST